MIASSTAAPVLFGFRFVRGLLSIELLDLLKFCARLFPKWPKRQLFPQVIFMV